MTACYFGRLLDIPPLCGYWAGRSRLQARLLMMVVSLPKIEQIGPSNKRDHTPPGNPCPRPKAALARGVAVVKSDIFLFCFSLHLSLSLTCCRAPSRRASGRPRRRATATRRTRPRLPLPGGSTSPTRSSRTPSKPAPSPSSQGSKRRLSPLLCARDTYIRTCL